MLSFQNQNAKVLPRLLWGMWIVLLTLAGCAHQTDLGGNIPIEGAVYSVHRSDHSLKTYMDIAIGNGFTGRLPDDIDSIIVTGPRGPLPVGKNDFNYSPQWRSFCYVGAGVPEPGSYTFQVTSGQRQGLATDVQSRVAPIPLPDINRLAPAPGETFSCVSSMFSWATLDDQRQLFYQIEIRGAEGRHVYRSPYGQGISCVRVPPDVLQPDRKYQWRVRVADSGDWIKVNNRAQSWWVTFKTTETLDRCDYEYRVPEADADWRTSSLEAQGVDQQRLEELVGLISSNRIKKIHGVLLFKNGYLVLEEYFAGYHRDRKHLLMSATKSFTSTLLGIARDKGFDIDPARKLAAYLPEYKDLLANGPKSGIILKDLLTMRAGLEWDEWTTPSSCLLMYQSSDPIRYVLEQKLDQPGRNFLYSTGLSTVLGRVLENSTGMTVDEFARQHLFTPLGITDWFLKKLPDGTAMTGGNLYLRPRDMAKLGYLFLHDGVWNGRRIVSRDWVRESIQPHVRGDLVSGTGYGYQWWRGSTRIGGREIDSFYAAGHGGQFVFVIPEENLIAVITSETDDNNAGDFRGYNILESYILPAVLRCNPDFALPARNVDSHPRITGRYHWAKAKLPLKIFVDQGKLYGQTVIFAGRFRMFPIDKGRFLCVSDDVGNFWLDTKEDSEGKIAGIKLTIGFSNLTFEKTTWPF